jgi:hypothetical protein
MNVHGRHDVKSRQCQGHDALATALTPRDSASTGRCTDLKTFKSRWLSNVDICVKRNQSIQVRGLAQMLDPNSSAR